MTSEPKLLNPNGKMLPDIERQLSLARKTKPLWAKLIGQAQSVNTLEGTINAEPGDYLCRGIQSETWPQKSVKLHEKYSPSGEIDSEGWERFDPIPDSVPVEAAEVLHPFRVIAQWGQLTGKANDYVVRSRTDSTDIWIVERAIFEASYELRPNPGKQPTLNPEIWKKVVAEEEARDEALRKANAGKSIVISQVEGFVLDEILEEKADELNRKPKSRSDSEGDTKGDPNQ